MPAAVGHRDDEPWGDGGGGLGDGGLGGGGLGAGGGGIGGKKGGGGEGGGGEGALAHTKHWGHTALALAPVFTSVSSQ